MFVIGCTSKAPKDFNLNQLTRVDIEVVKADESYEEAIMITDEETVDELRKIFKQIKWEPNVEPKMARREVCTGNPIFQNHRLRYMPERSSEYQIWFNQSK